MVLRDSDPAEAGGYRIEDRLGSGGMGVVYLARSASGRRLAVKVVHGQYADDDEFRARFRREVAAARQVSGAFTAPVVDADADAPRPWMATLYIPGADLGRHIRDHGPLPLPRLRELAAGLAEAIRDIHRAGVVHRDLKPANVMLADDGPRVIDFGISRATEFAASDVLTQTGRVMGTPPFMSPEQFSAPQDVGPAADIFSLGAVVAFAASGRGPFDSPSPYETAIRVVEGDPELDDVPAELLPFIRLCLEKEPKSRPTADELLRLLRNGDWRTTDDAPTPVDTGRPRRRTRRWLAVVAGTLALAAATTTVALTGDDSAPGNLPAGWRAWHKQAKDPSLDKDPMGPTALFNRCVASGTSLVCAGDEIMATRFALADGRNTWARPIDQTADGEDFGSSSSGGGTIIGARDGRVYVYGADDRPDDEASYPTRYTIQALNAGTGRTIWSTVTADGSDGTEPSSDQGASVAVPAGIMTVYGKTGRQFALLDADDGKVRWKRPLPNPDQYMTLLRSSAGQAYLLTGKYTTDNIESTSIAQLDPATGKPRWTVKVKGDMDIVGRHDGRLVLVNVTGARRTLTLVNTTSHVMTTVKLAKVQPEGAAPTLVNGTLYFTLSNGSIRAFDPATGRQAWASNSGVEQSGPPTASGTHLYVASPSGRLAALNRSTGEVEGTLPGRDDGAVDGSPAGAPLTLVGDALYVPYGLRSVYTVDVRDL
ncbi:serine/threonine protein kinase/outer membrane protein assembly factor BamB [Streptomyces canus]|uniref:serine/threonine-protein kinase n=1 Tax=Streptomyces canus TaxID=58343 RepID=UPI00278B5E0E|nr:serine/threonine-protein kinase [Streptomyces canus]MDQ0601746.1 serine/threonine protein kinase/outer membrane protein assembly factor BamB [Streptomyces canus]